ncbi:MAG: DUF808 domain-containing protein [Pseudomonadota bacterium]
MSGLLALLDDVAAIVRLTATQVDDIASQAAKVSAKVGATVLDDAAKAGAKAAGVIIDDAAVTPKYVTGLPAARELPIIWKIARASFFNKLVILLPVALLLDVFLPWLVTPLLMLGGCYLCFEGAEKIWHLLHPHPESHAQEAEDIDAAHLEETRVKGAIKTDFILSAEIMTITLNAIEADNRVNQGLALALVAIVITAVVYGSVAILVKMDDAGLKLSQIGRTDFVRNFGRGMVRFMPTLMGIIATIGTAAMLWVGGNIIVHGLHDLGIDWPYDPIKNAAKALGGDAGFLNWLVTATLDGILGLILGLALIPVVTKVIVPVASVFFPEKKTAAH